MSVCSLCTPSSSQRCSVSQESGLTPLQAAARINNIPMVDLLLEAGAATNVKLQVWAGGCACSTQAHFLIVWSLRTHGTQTSSKVRRHIRVSVHSPRASPPTLTAAVRTSQYTHNCSPLPPSSSSSPGTPTLCYPAPCSPCSRWARSACLARRECRATAAAGTAVATTSRRPACSPSYHWCRCRWWRWCRRWCCCHCCCCCRQPDRGSR